MTILSPPKSSYMLDVAGLELLHEQSNDWVSEIAFWRIEANFFYSLIIKKTLRPVPLKVKAAIKTIESELINITIYDLDKLERMVDDHEQFLSLLLKSKSHDEATYRKKHRELSQTFVYFEKRFKSIKKQIFDIVELIIKENNKSLN